MLLWPLALAAGPKAAGLGICGPKAWPAVSMLLLLGFGLWPEHKGPRPAIEAGLGSEALGSVPLCLQVLGLRVVLPRLYGLGQHSDGLNLRT